MVQADPEAHDVAAGDELAVAASPDAPTSDPVVVEAAPAIPTTPNAAPTRPATAQVQAAKPHGAKPGAATDAAAVPAGDGMALQATATEAGEESGAAQRAARIEEKRQAGEKNGVAEDAAANLAGASANPAAPAQTAAKPAAPQAAQGSLTATAVAAAGAGAEASLDNAGDQPDSRSLAEPTTDPTLRPAVSGEAPRAGTTEFAQQLAAARQGRGGPNPPALNQVAVHVQRAVQEGNDRLSIQLRPTDLGRIDVQIEFGGDGRMKAKIMAENPYTLDLLQKDSRALERALQDVGLRPEAGGLSFSLRDQGQQAQREDQGQRDRGFGMRMGADARADEVQAPPAYTPIIAPGRVDVRI
ncbi:flagellar hook-length control protein FliK [Aerophototrophica crusticola]|uniref:Flagellar hook-length control protein FliK n=1 Tax=Aerophototrophica crusticola TaxID=1709002 RepID=A0A858R617_9PROT|nr:flagellar hook-length control protein FliK [Rhodospirillaceae bacterium B3]